MFNPDWPYLINCLLKKGLTEKAIAEYVELTQPSINNLKTGVFKQPKYKSGSLIIDLAIKNGISIKKKDGMKEENLCVI